MSLILSLDLTSKKQAFEIFNEVKNNISCLKIGHTLMPYLTYNDINNSFTDKDIFLDFKLFDIPNTVYSAIKGYEENIKNLKYITIHGTAEDNMISKALSACIKSSLLAVISLTSSTLNESNFLKQAERNIKLGVKGFICPANMLTKMRASFGNNVLLVCPGIRASNSNQNDHKQHASPSFAYNNGANYIVVGRPIINASNKTLATKQYLKI